MQKSYDKKLHAKNIAMVRLRRMKHEINTAVNIHLESGGADNESCYIIRLRNDLTVAMDALEKGWV